MTVVSPEPLADLAVGLGANVQQIVSSERDTRRLRSGGDDLDVTEAERDGERSPFPRGGKLQIAG